MIITLEDYFGPWIDHADATPARKTNAGLLLQCVNALLLEYPYTVEINPTTGTRVSGMTFGGFRPHDCPQGAATSSHKDGKGIDVYDPHNSLDDWIGDDTLVQYGLHRENPSSTPHWCHLTTRAPGSGRRTFIP